MAKGLQWTITDHVCVVCMGRVLTRPILPIAGDANPHHVYRCADCGAEKTGSTAAVICTCGFKVAGRKNLGLKCEPNTVKTPEFPSEIIARQA